ncbi:MAG TPA: TonB-dependent receptor [Gemmatimonadaceae bacterium]
MTCRSFFLDSVSLMRFRFTLLASTVPAVSVTLRLAAQQPADTARVAPMVITATRVPIGRDESPATVDVITGEQLRLRGITSLSTALEMLPGVTFARSGSFGGNTSLFMRGGESKYVKVLIDGVAVNDPGGAIDFGSLTTDNVERIEIVRGPASVLYGADAVTGVIQIFTRRGHGASRTTVSARGGSFGTTDADATVLGPFANGDLSLGIARHDTRGIYPINNALHNSIASGAVHVALDSNTDLRFTARYGDEAYHFPTNGGGEIVDSAAFQTLERTVLGAELERRRGRVATRLSVASNSTSGGSNQPSSGDYVSIDRTRRRSADLRADIPIVESTTLTTGVQLEQEDERSESHSVFGTSEFSSIFEAARRNAAGYAELNAKLPAAAVITAGLRHDDNERFGKFDTYRVGASWSPLRGSRFRASVGTAFREPTFLENYSTGFVVGNPALRPERTRSWEAGFRQSLMDDRLELGVTHFDQRFRDMIDYTGSDKACGASYCNVALATAKGREFEARYTPLRALVIDANLTHLETKVLTPGFDTSSSGLYLRGENLIRRPTTSWTFGGAYTSSIGSVDLHVIRVGRRSDRDFRPFPFVAVVDSAYTRTDLGATLDLARITPRLATTEITLHAENLFDAKYESVFNFLSPRRTLLIGVRTSF